MLKKDERFESLVEMALSTIETINTFKAYLETLEAQLDPYFQGTTEFEYIATEFGTAMRILSEKVTLKNEKVPTVMAMLGSTFDGYFSMAVKCHATHECLEKLQSADSYLGQSLREHVSVERERLYRFTPADVKTVIEIPKEKAQ